MNPLQSEVVDLSADETVGNQARGCLRRRADAEIVSVQLFRNSEPARAARHRPPKKRSSPVVEYTEARRRCLMSPPRGGGAPLAVGPHAADPGHVPAAVELEIELGEPEGAGEIGVTRAIAQAAYCDEDRASARSVRVAEYIVAGFRDENVEPAGDKRRSRADRECARFRSPLGNTWNRPRSPSRGGLPRRRCARLPASPSARRRHRSKTRSAPSAPGRRNRLEATDTTRCNPPRPALRWRRKAISRRRKSPPSCFRLRLSSRSTPRRPRRRRALMNVPPSNGLVSVSRPDDSTA